MLRAAFPSTPFLSVYAVGSELWTSLREYIDCDTHQREPNNSSINFSSVRVLGFTVLAQTLILTGIYILSPFPIINVDVFGLDVPL